MSKLAKRLSKVESQVKKVKSKILIIDIERMKGSATIEFWDLGDYKNRRIHADSVTEWPKTICAAWNWYEDDKIEFASEWGDGRLKMIKRIWSALDEADFVCGHNIKGFDVKKLNTDFRDAGLTPPRPYRVIDTLTEARRLFGDESKTLDALNKRIGIDAKTDKYDVEVARAALAGDRVAQLTLQSYNEGDIKATKDLLTVLVPWCKFGVNIAVNAEETAVGCTHCGSENYKKSGLHSTGIYRYQMYTCKDCGGHFKGILVSKGPSVRSL